MRDSITIAGGLLWGHRPAVAITCGYNHDLPFSLESVPGHGSLVIVYYCGSHGTAPPLTPATCVRVMQQC